MSHPTDRPQPPSADLAWSRVGQSVTATGVLVAVIALAAVLRDDPTEPTRTAPGADAVWLLWTLAVVLTVNGFVLWMMFDRRYRSGLFRPSDPPH